MADASTITYTQSGTSAVNRTLLSRLHEIVSATDFDVDLTGAADSTAALQAALNSLQPRGGTVTIPPGKLLLSTITLPPFTTLQGAQGSLGENDNNFDPTAHGTALMLKGGATIYVRNCAKLTQVGVLSNSVTYPCPNTATAAQNNINTFANNGIGISIVEDDATVEDVLIIGFNQAVLSGANSSYSQPAGGPSRPSLTRVWFDCAAGIDISACYDIARVVDCHGWPFYTGHLSISGGTPTLGQRPGPAYNLHGRVDGGLVRGCFSYAHVTGFQFTPPAAGDSNGLLAVTAIQCTADNDSSLYTTNGSVGFSIGNGFANGVYLDDCYASSNTYGYGFHHTSGHVSAGRITATNNGYAGMYLDASSVGSIDTFVAGAYCPQGAIEFVSPVGSWNIGRVIAIGTSPNNLFNYNATDVANIHIDQVASTGANASLINLPHGFTGKPQNLQNTNYTFTATDAGRHVYNNSGANISYYIPANSSVSFPLAPKLPLSATIQDREGRRYMRTAE